MKHSELHNAPQHSVDVISMKLILFLITISLFLVGCTPTDLSFGDSVDENSSSYLAFDQVAYEQSLAEGKIILLDCSGCAQELLNFPINILLLIRFIIMMMKQLLKNKLWRSNLASRINTLKLF